MWTPTTKGATPSIEICAYEKCIDKNIETAFQTIDYRGSHFFCWLHWGLIAPFFLEVKSCGRCFRNHKADWSRENINIDCVGHQNKWWELCKPHWDKYEELVPIAFPNFFD